MNDANVPGLLTDEIRAMVGEEVTYTAPEPLGAAAIRYFAVAVGDTNPLYTDAAYARAHGHPDVIAPPTLITETNQGVTLPRDEAGFIGHRWPIEVPGARQVRGGNTYVFHRPVLAGDVITATWRLTDATERTTRTGAAMLILTSTATYTNQDGDLLATNEETIIHVSVGKDAA